MTHSMEKRINDKCLNCQSELSVDDNYCPNCGAHQFRNRLTTKEVFIELFDVIIIWNKDYFKTFFHLLVKPAITIRYYIEGGRKRYLNPLLYMLFSFFLYMLVLSFTGGEVIFIGGMKAMTEGYNTGYTEALAEDESESDIPQEALNSTAIGNLDKISKILFFIMLPILALSSRLIFKSSKLNYAEHLVINAFFLSQVMIIGIIGIPISLLAETGLKFIGSIPAILILVYIVYYQFKIYSDNILISIFKSIGFILISFIFIAIVFLLIVFTVGTVFKSA